MADHRNPFATWLDNTTTLNRVSNTKLAAAQGIDVTAPAVIKWRSGASIPRDSSVIDAIADFFGADRAHIRTLAGRAGLGMDVGAIEEDIEALALDAQSALKEIHDPKFREFRKQELMRLYQHWKDENEEWFDYLDGLLKREDGER